jgi:hypothetical protein
MKGVLAIVRVIDNDKVAGVKVSGSESRHAGFSLTLLGRVCVVEALTLPAFLFIRLYREGAYEF